MPTDDPRSPFARDSSTARSELPAPPVWANIETMRSLSPIPGVTMWPIAGSNLMLNFVRIEPDEEKGLLVSLGAEFYPPAPPEPPPAPLNPEIVEEEDEPQPLVPGQPNAFGVIEQPAPPPETPKRRPRAKKAAGDSKPKTKRAPRKRKTE